jgi:integrase
MATSPSPEIVRDIIRSLEDESVARYQDPKIEKREDVEEPFYFIRPYVKVIGASGIESKRRAITLGRCKDMTMRQAKAAKERIMAPINAGSFMVQCQLPLSAIIDKYIDVALPKLREGTRQNQTYLIEKHIKLCLGNLRMCDIGRLEIEAWLNDRAKLGLSHGSLKNLRVLLGAIYTKAKEWKLYEGDYPGRGIKVAGSRSVHRKALPKGEWLQMFLSEVRGIQGISTEGAQLMILTGAISGFRIGEILGLTVDDIDPERQTIEVSRTLSQGRLGPPKTERSARIRDAGPLCQMLLSYRHRFARGGYVFADQNDLPLRSNHLQTRVFKPAAERAGIYTKGFGLHKLRHLNITVRQSVGGATPIEAQVGAGHSSLATTLIYTHTDEDREKEQVDRMLERWGLVKADGRVQ